MNGEFIITRVSFVAGIGKIYLVDMPPRNIESDLTGNVMRKAKSAGEAKIDRPRRAVITRKEALKRMKEFSKRKERFIATVRTSKSGSPRP
jgi:hypothetical protein